MRHIVIVVLIAIGCATAPPPLPVPPIRAVAELDYDAVWAHAVAAWNDRYDPAGPACYRAWREAIVLELPQTVVQQMCAATGAQNVVGCEVPGEPYRVAVAQERPPAARCDTMAHEALHVLQDCTGRKFAIPVNGDPSHPPELFAVRTDALLIDVQARALADCLRVR